MLSRTLRRRTVFACLPYLLGSLAVLMSLVPVRAQDDGGVVKPEKHGRKYKAPPDTSQIEVTVIRDFNKKPIVNAAVVFHPVKDGVDEGNLEMKTDPDGKATIDVIPTGSAVRIQVIATGFATFAEDYQVDEASRKITIAMIKPRAQVSTYIDESGKPASIKPGVQEPPPIKRPSASGSTPTGGSSTTPDASSNSGSKPQP
jgi:hypothetical protein